MGQTAMKSASFPLSCFTLFQHKAGSEMVQVPGEEQIGSGRKKEHPPHPHTVGCLLLSQTGCNDRRMVYFHFSTANPFTFQQLPGAWIRGQRYGEGWVLLFHPQRRTAYYCQQKQSQQKQRPERPPLLSPPANSRMQAGQHYHWAGQEFNWQVRRPPPPTSTGRQH